MKYSNLNQYAKTKRMEKGWSQFQLAASLGYSSAQYVSNWERELCPVPYNKLKKLIQVLGLTPHVIMTLELDRLNTELSIAMDLL